MSTQRTKGFTIIEISLFVAISGLLALGLLTGWAVAINGQRYKDSVDSLYSYIQQQYSLAYNVENGRDANLGCDSNSVIQEGSSTVSRGQSNCVLLGRYIRVTNGSTFESFAVVGNETSDGTGGFSDYEPKVVTQNIGLSQSLFEVPWQAQVRGRGSGNTGLLNIGIAILRSPSTGTLYTYVVSDNGSLVDLSAVVTPANQTEQYFCVDPGPGTSIQGERQAIYLPQYAASLNAVETIGDNSGC